MLDKAVLLQIEVDGLAAQVLELQAEIADLRAELAEIKSGVIRKKLRSLQPMVAIAN